MKRVLIGLAVTGLAVSQSIGDSVPAFAAPCLTSGVTSATTCSVMDAACQCTSSNYQAIYTAALACVLNGCGADVAIGQVLPAAERFCLDAVGPISAPPVGETAVTPTTTPANTKAPTQPAPEVEPTSVTATGSFAEGSFQTSAAPPTSAFSAAVVESTGGTNPAFVGSWLAIGAALVAFGV